MARSRDTALALVAAPVALAVVVWFDTAVVTEAQRTYAATFDAAGGIGLVAAGSFVVAGAALLVAQLAWRSRSALVGVMYAVVGACFAAQMWIYVTLGGSRNGAPPILPESIVSALSQVQLATVGSLNAVGTLGAAMVIAGVAVLVRSFARRSSAQ